MVDQHTTPLSVVRQRCMAPADVKDKLVDETCSAQCATQEVHWDEQEGRQSVCGPSVNDAIAGDDSQSKESPVKLESEQECGLAQECDSHMSSQLEAGEEDEESEDEDEDEDESDEGTDSESDVSNQD